MDNRWEKLDVCVNIDGKPWECRCLKCIKELKDMKHQIEVLRFHCSNKDAAIESLMTDKEIACEALGYYANRMDSGGTARRVLKRIK